MQKAYGHQCIYLMASEQDKVVGVLPLVKMGVPLLGSHFCSLPFCDLGGVLADSDAAQQELLEHAKAMMSATRIETAQLRHSAGHQVEEPEPGAKVRMLLSLESSADAQFKKFKSKLRSQVRKAEKNGISFFEGTTEEHRLEFYRVMQVNMHQLGSPVHSRKWFDSVLQEYGAQARLGLVEFDGVVVGGAIILLCGSSVTVPWASTLPAYNHLSPNMLLYWGLLSIAADAEYSCFDFGRSTVGEGTFRFKKQWGAVAVPLEWQEFNQLGLQNIQSAEASSLRDKIAELWRRMPAFVVNLVGPTIRRYISL